LCCSCCDCADGNPILLFEHKKDTKLNPSHKYMNPFHTGKLVIFQVRYTNTWVSFEMIPFLLVAVLGGIEQQYTLSQSIDLAQIGLIGAFFIKMNIKMCSFRKTSKLSQYQIREVMVVATLTALISYINPYMRGNSGEIMANLFAECSPTDNSELCK
jgi:chloride channel 3/4/5